MTWGTYKMRHLCLHWSSTGKAVMWISQSSSRQWMHREFINGFSGCITGYILFNFNYFWHLKPTSEYSLRWFVQKATFLSYSFCFYFIFFFPAVGFHSYPAYCYPSADMILLQIFSFYRKTGPRRPRRQLLD